MNRTHYALSRALAREVEHRAEWDEPPQVYRVHVKSGRPRLVELPVPVMVWNAARPPEVLERLVDAMRHTGFKPPPWTERDGELYGMAFRHEGWWVETKPGTMAHAHAAQMGSEHQLHRHPQRVEIRMMYAVDRNQITYAITQYRADPQTPAEQLIAYPDGRGEGFGPKVEELLASMGAEVHPAGAIVEALDRMVELLLGVKPLERPSSVMGGPEWS